MSVMKGVAISVFAVIGTVIIYAVLGGATTTGWNAGVINLIWLLPLIVIAMVFMKLLGSVGGD